MYALQEQDKDYNILRLFSSGPCRFIPASEVRNVITYSYHCAAHTSTWLPVVSSFLIILCYHYYCFVIAYDLLN